ncbi:MAG: hypothetical protein IPG67_05980 [Acidobacteria bacterium]|nr:hypothetical protein [Acidobacteriota bacterium]
MLDAKLGINFAAEAMSVIAINDLVPLPTGVAVAVNVRTSPTVLASRAKRTGSSDRFGDIRDVNHTHFALSHEPANRHALSACCSKSERAVDRLEQPRIPDLYPIDHADVARPSEGRKPDRT